MLAYSYIRFSTPEQARGDSLRRQIALAEDYARRHGLTLDRKLNLRDLGVSSFRGTNAATGALGKFLEAIALKKVVPGSVLLVENLDRLSRDQIAKSLQLLLRIIDHGIEVVTLTDEMRFNQETINSNPMALTISLYTFYRAHEESALKSRRLGAAWSNKRKNASTEKLTAKAPAWLKLSADRKTFEIIPNRAALVRRIFKLTLSGHGKRAIAQKLNLEKVQTWGAGVGWHDSYVQKILHARAVVGEYQPHHYVNGKRKPTGEPLAGYFPAIIDEATYAKVQNRPVRPHGGPVGKHVTNLFTKLTFCGFTDLSMRYIDKGTRRRGKGRWRYLTNDGQRLGLPTSSIRYEIFEKAFLAYARHLNWQDILEAGKPSDRLAEIDEELATSQLQLRDTQARLKRLMNIAETTENPPKNILSSLHLLEVTEERLAASIQDLIARRHTEESQIQNVAAESASLAELAGNATDYDTRIKLREEIRRKVKRIKVWAKFAAPSVLPHRGMRSNPDPSFEIEFVNGVTRHITLKGFNNPDTKSTLEIDGEQIPWAHEPTEETNRMAQRPSSQRAQAREKRPAKR